MYIHTDTQTHIHTDTRTDGQTDRQTAVAFQTCSAAESYTLESLDKVGTTSVCTENRFDIARRPKRAAAMDGWMDGRTDRQTVRFWMSE